MIDWHSHILPGMDDGSKNAEETKALLQMQREQGIKTVVATPHFYANDESVESFLKRREESFNKIKAEELPEILLGAEVSYYQGISRLTDLKRLCLQNSKILLLEMPVGRWTETVIRELTEMSGNGSVKIILAHIERYIGFQKKETLQKLLENGILFQANADFFISLSTRRKALTLLKEGKIHFIGSDCHNVRSRPPKIGRAFETIRRKLGETFVSQMNEYGFSILTK